MSSLASEEASGINPFKTIDGIESKDPERDSDRETLGRSVYHLEPLTRVINISFFSRRINDRNASSKRKGGVGNYGGSRIPH